MNGFSFEGFGRRALEANVRYYEAVGRASVEYLRAVVGALGEAQAAGAREARPAAAPRPRPVPAERSTSTAAPIPAMVLEAEAGSVALGAFLVENRLREKVSAPIVSSSFVDEAGGEINARVVFDPEVVTLEPGEQLLVRIMAEIGDELEPDLAYRGDVSVPGLGDSTVPIVLRRRSSQVKPKRTAARRKKPPTRTRSTRR